MFLDVLAACTWYVHDISLQIYIIAVVHFLYIKDSATKKAADLCV